ncbi:MAG: FeoB-associated Cys-rich membrane protein [Oscillospiraceae bacterium]|nr:FeoB-associated Cys-rich membrane protein [Oscillospiraceae bacterium]
MTDLIVIAVLAVIVGLAARYVYRAKKSGAKCIGCPVEGGCSGKCSCGRQNEA